MREIYLIFELLFGVNEAYIKQKTNKPSITEYRFLMAWTMRNALHVSYESIQLELGYKSHQNIVHAVKMINNWKENNTEIKLKVKKIKSALRLFLNKRVQTI